MEFVTPVSYVIMSPENEIGPRELPVHLPELSQVEEMIIDYRIMCRCELLAEQCKDD